MAFIGKSPSIGSYSMLDNLTASATASYSLTLDSVAFVPESANHLLVSLNGHIQKAGSSYTVSSSTLTFSSALTSSDSIDFILALGNVLDIGTPSDATVTNAKTNFVSTSSAAGLDIKGDGTTAGTLRLMCEQGSHGIKLRSPAHSASASYTLTFPTTDGSADEFLKTDGSGVLSWATAGGTNTPAFSARLSSALTLNNTTATDVVFQTEFFDVGSCYNASTGVFTVPSNEGGKYCISVTLEFSDGNGNVSDLHVLMQSTISGSTNSDQVARAESTSNGTLFTRKSLSYTTVLSLSAGDTINIRAYQETNNSSAITVKNGSRNSVFSAFKLIE